MWNRSGSDRPAAVWSMQQLRGNGKDKSLDNLDVVIVKCSAASEKIRK